MKRIILALSVIAMLLAVLASCSQADAPSTEVSEFSQTITLPVSGQNLELEGKQKTFAPYISNSLLKDAESKIADETAEYQNKSDFYLQMDAGYLCLALEVIVQTPDGNGAYGGHDHIFFSERISTVSYEEIQSQNGCVQFFPYAVTEFSEECAFDPELFEFTKLGEGNIRYLQQLCGVRKTWNDDSVVDRIAFMFDGRIYLKTNDYEGWMHFGFEQQVLYYNGCFATMPPEVEKMLKTLCPDDHDAEITIFVTGADKKAALYDDDKALLLQFMSRTGIWIDGCDISGERLIRFNGNGISLIYCDNDTLYDLAKNRHATISKQQFESIISRYTN